MRRFVSAIALLLCACSNSGTGPVASVRGTYVVDSVSLAAMQTDSRDPLRAHSITFDGRGGFVSLLEYRFAAGLTPARDSTAELRGAYAVKNGTVTLRAAGETLTLDIRGDGDALSGLSAFSKRLNYSRQSR